jgi:xanthine dehydrogenase D subunit
MFARMRSSDTDAVRASPELNIGVDAAQPDAARKTTGEFAYASDLWVEGALWGATLRCPHAHARIVHVDVAAAAALPGVHAALTAEDVPGARCYGVFVADQPVLAWDVVRHQGEPVAIVAADDPETARRAVESIDVSYEVLQPLVDMEAALLDGAPQVHPGRASGNVCGEMRIRHGGSPEPRDAPVVVRGSYETGMQDHAFLGPESGLALPDADGGVTLYVATQHLHHDRDQVAACLGLDAERVRLRLGGVGGAFGGREDLSVHVHACMLALATGRPVKMAYARDESFLGHVHRHPARMWYETGVSRDGRIRWLRAQMLLDGGAYLSKTPAVVNCAAAFMAGPYDIPDVEIHARGVFTNNPPCGAMRGFGATQACFGYESHLDAIARALRLAPLDVRRRNALTADTTLPNGQRVGEPAPVGEIIDWLAERPLPEPPTARRAPRELPGANGNSTRGEGVRRGVGYALGIKAIGMSGGVETPSTARVRLTLTGERTLAEVHSSATECGQGIAGVQAQIARAELAVDDVAILTADTTIEDAGASAASRQTVRTGAAVRAACEAVRELVVEVVRARIDPRADALVDGIVVAADGTPVATLAESLAFGPVEAKRTVAPPPTARWNTVDGQGDVHIAFAFVGHRAVVVVEVDLGLVRVSEIATVQDVGRAINPAAVERQIAGGTSQGLGLALMEEVVVGGGLVRNGSFTDYLIPTALDMPPLVVKLLEHPQPTAVYGLNGVGEPPSLSSTPAVANAVRDATGATLPRVPIGLRDIALAVR